MNAVKVDSAKRIRLKNLTPGDYYEPEVPGGNAEENRWKTGEPCLLPPSTSSGRTGPV